MIEVTLKVPEEVYAAIQTNAANARITPEELLAKEVAEKYAPASVSQPAQAQTAAAQRDAYWAPLLELMRARGHLTEPLPGPEFPDADPLPPAGTPERKAYEERLAEELGEAWEKSGLSILDLIERR